MSKNTRKKQVLVFILILIFRSTFSIVLFFLPAEIKKPPQKKKRMRTREMGRMRGEKLKRRERNRREGGEVVFIISIIFLVLCPYNLFSLSQTKVN